MRDVRCLLFDVGGSVFDWETAIVHAIRTHSPAVLTDVEPASFAEAWRRHSMIHMYEIAEERTAWQPFDEFIDASLTDALDECGAPAPEPMARRALLGAWRSMPAWPEVTDALERLRRRFTIAPHTILSLAAVTQSSKAGGLTWDAIVSCDALGATKTNPQSYLRGAATIGFAPDQILYVAAHTSDLEVVRSLGFRTAYVESRLDEHGEPDIDGSLGDRYDVDATDYADLADQLT